MILRRPYAFLIKHFRLIHLILFALLAVITYNASTLLNFFKDYITANGNMEILSSNYINVFIYIAPIIIIGLSILIFYLMKYKDKPRLYYIILIIVSILCTGVYTYLYLNIRSLETTTVSARIIRLYRDIARSNFYVLFVMCIPTLIRGLGFDIKKFNFSKDLKELNLSEEDSAEVEVSIDVSSNGLKRTGRRTLRELKYYYVENKFFINIILGTLILILVMVFPFNKYVVNRNLKEGEVLGTSAFNIKVTDSYLTDRKRISKDNSYIILKISVIGKVNKYSLDLDHFILEGKNNNYVPSQKFYLYFNDIGIGYRNNILDTTSYKDYILVFNINNVAYSAIILYLSSMIIDKMLIGISTSKLFYIKTDKINEVKDFIIRELKTGVTIINVEGGYSAKKGKLIMCVVDNMDYYLFKESVLEIDPKAFFIIDDCYEVKKKKKRERINLIEG